MPSWGSYSYLFGPLVAFGAVAVLIGVLRWSSGRPGSLVASRPRPGRAEDYGVLVPVAAPATYVEGEVARRRLEASGVRATLAQTLDGPRLLVWPDDAARAKAVLARG